MKKGIVTRVYSVNEDKLQEAIDALRELREQAIEKIVQQIAYCFKFGKLACTEQKLGENILKTLESIGYVLGIRGEEVSKRKIKKTINCPVCDSFDLSTLLQKALVYNNVEVNLGFTKQTSPLRKCNKCGREFVIVSKEYPDIFAIAKSISKEVKK